MLGGPSSGIRLERELQEVGFSLCRVATGHLEGLLTPSPGCIPGRSLRHQHPEGWVSWGWGGSASLPLSPKWGGAHPQALPTLPSPLP